MVRQSTLWFLLLLMMAVPAAAKDKLHLFTDHYPPYTMTLTGQPFAHNAEEISGICTDMVKAAMTKVPYDIQMRVRNWQYGINRVKRKSGHGIFCTARTEERDAWFSWVGPLTSMGWSLFARPDSDIKLKTLEEAKKYKIGGYKSDVMTEYLVERGYNVSVINDGLQNPLRLQRGLIDLWVSDELHAPYVASDTVDMIPRKVLTFNSSPLYLAFNKETDEAVIDAFNEAVAELIKDGTFSDIERSYGR